ncbi:type VII secretion-associated serine protease mycosin [Amycolatopsis nigrescens]|uniref:type VII secretion-associated serine protease mycosin n=1 Tax=Amycolatopsis nigrescens TaxID=381445 RepID=UPI000477B447|nr:type VII secretion-associated serine protease mycosin [Amycolatopsis nigrescens]
MAPARRNSRTRVRPSGPTGRTATVLLAATIGMLGPGVGPLTATAQAQDGEYYATPPPVQESQVPPDAAPKPDRAYEKGTACVTRNLGETVVLRNRPWGQGHLQIDDVHKMLQASNISAGGGVKVAVIDTGVTEHAYLSGRLEAGGDYVEESKQGLEDCDGHGTEVAGIIAAKTPPDIAFRGVAPDAQIVSIRQSSQNYKPAKESQTAQPPATGQQPPPEGGTPSNTATPGTELPPSNGGGQPAGDEETGSQQGGGGKRQQDQEGAAGTVDTLAQAVRHAADISGVKVINMSVDNCRPANGSISAGERRLQAAVRYAVNKDVVVVAAAGNTGENCPQNGGPGADPNRPSTIVTPPWFGTDVLSVAAIDQSGGVAEFSVHGPWVSVAAPGTDIISLDPATKGSTNLANQTIENGEPQYIQGTSFAAPYVAGVAALVRAKYPDLNAREVMRRITSTAQHPGAASGRDNFVGYGVVNPMAALTAVIPAEENLPPAASQPVPPEMPGSSDRDWTPMIVALAGTGGGLIALLITLFTVHTIRRTRDRSATQRV